MPRPLLEVVIAALVLVLVLALAGAHGFQIEEATLASIQLGFNNGSLTSAGLVRFYLDRISSLKPLLHAVIEVNPDAAPGRARRRRALLRRPPSGQRRAARRARPAQGQHRHARRAQHHGRVVRASRLRGEAGRGRGAPAAARRGRGAPAAARRGKANMDEWANFRSFSGGGWSARGGKGRNPYVLSATPCGSSTGSAIAAAASMAAVTLGTETDGSILCPASVNSVVGIKPTVGLTSRAGVVPISPRQDTVGPICHTVADAVHVLDAIVGYDAVDAPATMAASKYIPTGGYMQFLKKDGLRGKRIGVPNGFFTFSNGTVQQMVYEQHLNTMRKQGAIVIENLDIENLSVLLDSLNNGQLIALPAEFKLSLNSYLSNLLYSLVRSLEDIIAFNNAHPVEENMKEIGQSVFLVAENTTGIGALERAATSQLNKLSANGLEKLMKEHKLDAIVTPNNAASSVLAIDGMPGITVPAGYGKLGVPFGLYFGGLRGYEPRLIEMAYAFEQVTMVRKTPTFLP